MSARRFLAAATVACVVLAVGCFAMAWRSAAHPQLVAAAAVDGAAAHGTGPGHRSPLHRPTEASAAMRPGQPVSIAIPAIGLSAAVVPVGLTPAGRLRMPDPSVAGWYRFGPAPGARGPSVLVGHVDSQHGPAVFYRLSGIRPGETVQVLRADGSRSRFIVSRVTVVAKGDFPSRAVFGPTSGATIRLITCTGPFDADIGYRDSLIIWGRARSS